MDLERKPNGRFPAAENTGWTIPDSGELFTPVNLPTQKELTEIRTRLRRTFARIAVSSVFLTGISIYGATVLNESAKHDTTQQNSVITGLYPGKHVKEIVVTDKTFIREANNLNLYSEKENIGTLPSGAHLTDVEIIDGTIDGAPVLLAEAPCSEMIKEISSPQVVTLTGSSGECVIYAGNTRSVK